MLFNVPYFPRGTKKQCTLGTNENARHQILYWQWYRNISILGRTFYHSNLLVSGSSCLNNNRNILFLLRKIRAVEQFLFCSLLLHVRRLQKSSRGTVRKSLKCLRYQVEEAQWNYVYQISFKFDISFLFLRVDEYLNYSKSSLRLNSAWIILSSRTKDNNHPTTFRLRAHTDITFQS